MNHLKNLEFAGSLEWVYNEEGSGAKFWKTSAYFPDDLENPITNSGITIDPGIDLGSGDRFVVDTVLVKYLLDKHISERQFMLLKDAVGLRRTAAAGWYKKYSKEFRRVFLLPESIALKVLDEYSAPAYWNPLLRNIPLLRHIKPGIKEAVHTALLSHSYNRGQSRTVLLAHRFIKEDNYIGLADAIEAVKHKSAALNQRRKREAELIRQAAITGEFILSLEEVNCRPMITIPYEFHDQFLMQPVPVPEKVEIK